MVLFYKTEHFEGQLHSSAEGAVYWVRLDELPGMALANDMDQMMKIFLEDGLSEFFYFRENGGWRWELK